VSHGRVGGGEFEDKGRRATSMRQRDHVPAVPLPVEVCQVLELLASGLCTHEVAARTGSTVHEVRGHLVRAILELDATSKLDAIVKAAALGLIAPTHRA